MTKYIAIIDDLAAQHGVSADGSASGDAKKAATPVSTSEDLLVSVSESGLLTLQLNRPARYNALNREMYDAITQALESSKSQDNVKAVLLKSTGAMFSSGNDLSMFTDNPNGVSFEEMADAGAILLENFVNAFLTYPKPIVAAVQGPAVGIAATLLALCDLVYVSETVTLHTPFTALGQTPEACSSVLFPKIMGPAQANAMLLLGEKLSAKDAVNSGLATAAFGVAEFDQQVQEKVDLLLSRYPISMKQSKALVRSPELIKELQAVNHRECQTLKKMWLGSECMDAVLKFQSRKK
uniref:Enoyl-CoA hydratase n=1 Tax=Globisporangium ultimum (strain ATCC 200006 / CBS 805.95 / DAOM BR144) TaxID=431595 RepID=K3WF97_GLOUD